MSNYEWKHLTNGVSSSEESRMPYVSEQVYYDFNASAFRLYIVNLK